MHLNSRAFRYFLHDVHHAYLLLHRAMQTLPPTSIPDLEPMPHPSDGLFDQHPELQPMEEPGEEAAAPSPALTQSPFEVDDSTSQRFFNAIMAQDSDDADATARPPTIFQPLPRPVRHLAAPEPHELPQPKPKTAVKKPGKRPRIKRSMVDKSPSLPEHSEAVSPWTPEEIAILKELKTNQKQRPSWKAVAERLKSSEADVKNQWSLCKVKPILISSLRITFPWLQKAVSFS